MSTALAQLVPAELRERLRGSGLVLQRPVWGRRHGRHRSARAGIGLDFRGHRQYVPGDDPRLVEWRAVARRDRLVLRQTEAEDQLGLVVLTDLGGAMAYGEGEHNKATFMRALAGGLAWLAARQGDAIGLALGCDGTADATLARPATGGERLRFFAHRLANTEPAGVCPWNELLAATTPRLGPRSLVVAFSDFLDLIPTTHSTGAALQQLLRGMAHLRARDHTVCLVQVVHRDELEFPWGDPSMLEFVDLRGLLPAIVGPGTRLRERYLANMRAHLEALERGCQANGLHLVRLVTDRSLGESFVRLIGHFAGRTTSGEHEVSDR